MNSVNAWEAGRPTPTGKAVIGQQIQMRSDVQSKMRMANLSISPHGLPAPYCINSIRLCKQMFWFFVAELVWRVCQELYNGRSQCSTLRQKTRQKEATTVGLSCPPPDLFGAYVSFIPYPKHSAPANQSGPI